MFWVLCWICIFKGRNMCTWVAKPLVGDVPLAIYNLEGNILRVMDLKVDPGFSWNWLFQMRLFFLTGPEGREILNIGLVPGPAKILHLHNNNKAQWPNNIMTWCNMQIRIKSLCANRFGSCPKIVTVDFSSLALNALGMTIRQPTAKDCYSG